MTDGPTTYESFLVALEKNNFRRLVFEHHGVRVKISTPKHLETKNYRTTIVNKFYGYERYGYEQAVELAIKHRDEAEKKFKLKPIGNYGIPGVTRRIKAEWVANWRQDENGKRVTRSKAFPFRLGDTEGETQAFTKAANYRKQMEKKHDKSTSE